MKYLAIILILFWLAIVFIPHINGNVPENYSFYDVVCIMGECGIHIYIVNSWEDFPHESCKGPSIRGCSYIGQQESFIYLRPVQYTDKYGFSTFEHEALHILCKCNFHIDQEISELLMLSEDPFKFVLENKENIRFYNNRFI